MNCLFEQRYYVLAVILWRPAMRRRRPEHRTTQRRVSSRLLVLAAELSTNSTSGEYLVCLSSLKRSVTMQIFPTTCLKYSYHQSLSLCANVNVKINNLFSTFNVIFLKWLFLHAIGHVGVLKSIIRDSNVFHQTFTTCHQ